MITCPYCQSEAELRDKSAVYGGGRYFGLMWVCKRYPKCDAYVGCHPNTDKPLGRLADAALRKAKERAHDAFDPLWKAKAAAEKISKGKARGAGYRWLAQALGIDPKDCHIGMFDVALCNRVVQACRPFLAQQRRVN